MQTETFMKSPHFEGVEDYEFVPVESIANSLSREMETEKWKVQRAD